jgi:hypothetical protein
MTGEYFLGCTGITLAMYLHLKQGLEAAYFHQLLVGILVPTKAVFGTDGAAANVAGPLTDAQLAFTINLSAAAGIRLNSPKQLFAQDALA